MIEGNQESITKANVYPQSCPLEVEDTLLFA